MGLKLSQNLIDKRVRFGVASLIFSLLLGFSFFSSPSFKLQSALIGLFAAILVNLAAVSFSFLQKGFWKYLITPVLFVPSIFVFSFFYQSLNRDFVLLFLIFSGVINYISLLCVNVFLVSLEKGSDLPLIGPAKSFLFLVGQYSLFIAVVLGYKMPLPLYISFVGSITVFSLAALSYFYLGRTQGKIGVEPFLISWLCTQTFIALAFVRLEDIFKSLICVGTFFVLCSLFESFINNSFKKRQVFEYALIYLGIFTLIQIV